MLPDAVGLRLFLRWRLHGGDEDSSWLENGPGTLLGVPAHSVQDDIDVAGNVLKPSGRVIDGLIDLQFARKSMLSDAVPITVAPRNLASCTAT